MKYLIFIFLVFSTIFRLSSQAILKIGGSTALGDSRFEFTPNINDRFTTFQFISNLKYRYKELGRIAFEPSIGFQYIYSNMLYAVEFTVPGFKTIQSNRRFLQYQGLLGFDTEISIISNVKLQLQWNNQFNFYTEYSKPFVTRNGEILDNPKDKSFKYLGNSLFLGVPIHLGSLRLVPQIRALNFLLRDNLIFSEKSSSFPDAYNEQVDKAINWHNPLCLGLNFEFIF
jgi:hypothetical protein